MALERHIVIPELLLREKCMNHPTCGLILHLNPFAHIYLRPSDHEDMPIS